jgi:arylsulfatase A-like enzyme
MRAIAVRLAESAAGGLLLASMLAAPSCTGHRSEGTSGDARQKDAGIRHATPNVILISIDTLRADRLGAYGYDAHAVSPRIDALAADGILFENAITTAPWTTPAHMSLLTSLQPTSHGVITPFAELREGLKGGGRFRRLPDSRTTLAEVLKNAGYATAAFTGGVTLDPRIGFDQGFDLYDTSMQKLDSSSVPRLERWIAESGGRPFFLFWHTFEVHAPYLQTTYLGDALPPDATRRVKEALARRARLFEEKRAPGYGLKKTLIEQGAFTRAVCDALYMGGVHSVDGWVGELLDGLRRAGLYDQTLVVLTSDHGEELGQRSESQIYDGHGHTLYEELVRIPLIVKLPGSRHGGTRVRGVVSLLDVMPTILDVLGLRPRHDEMQGVSLRPRWEDPARAEAEAAFAEALGVPAEKKCLRTGRYKYIVSIDPASVRRFGRSHVPKRPSAVELYDLERDPKERDNLLASPAGGDSTSPLVARLDEDLRAFASRKPGQTEAVDLPRETIEGLKELGYIQ